MQYVEYLLMIRKLILATFALAMPLAAHAQPATAQPGIDMTIALNNPDGTVMTECKEAAEDGKTCLRKGPVTRGEMVVGALNQTPKAPLTADVTVARGALAMRLLTDKDAHLSTVQIADIERLLLALPAPPALIMQTILAIDPGYKVDESKLN